MSRDKKKLLLRNAARLFLERGYHRTTMKSLAEASGFQAPAIYYYFKSKEEILFHLQEEGAQMFRQNVIDGMSKLEGPEEKIKVLIANVTKLLINFGEIPLLMSEDFWPKKVNRTRKNTAKEFCYVIRHTLQDLAESKGIRNPIDPTVATFSLVAMTSWIQKWYDPEGKISAEKLIYEMTRFFFQGFYVNEVEFGEVSEMREIFKNRPIMDGIMMLPPLSEDPYLLAGRCSKCGRTFFPKKEICPNCFDTGLINEIALSSEGKLASFTVVRRSLGTRETPYALGYIETPEQIRLLAPLTNCRFEELRIGMDMELVFEVERTEDGNLVVIYKYKPSGRDSII